MKLKPDIILHQVAGQTVLLDLSRSDANDTMVTTNGTGAFLLQQLQGGCEDTGSLVNALLDKYDVTKEDAKLHVQMFTDGLRELGFLDE